MASSTNHRCAPATTPLVSLQFLPGVLQWRDRQERAAPAAGACRWTWRALAAHHPVDSKVPPLRHPRRSPPRPGSGRSARGARGVPQLAARLQAPRPRSTQRRCSRPAPADHSRCKLQAASRFAGFTCVSNGSARHSASGLTCTVKLPGETPVGSLASNYGCATPSRLYLCTGGSQRELVATFSQLRVRHVPRAITLGNGGAHPLRVSSTRPSAYATPCLPVPA